MSEQRCEHGIRYPHECKDCLYAADIAAEQAPTVTSLGDELPREIARVRKVLKAYEDPELQGAGAFAALFMRRDIEGAEKAIRDGDVIAMIRFYASLKDYEL